MLLKKRLQQWQPATLLLLASVVSGGLAIALPQAAQADEYQVAQAAEVDKFMEEIRISPGFTVDPVLVRSNSGERFLEVGCGFVDTPEEPNHYLHLEEPFYYLRLNAVVAIDIHDEELIKPVNDLELLVLRKDTGETVCNDNANDTLMPEIAGGPWPAGEYYIFVSDFNEYGPDDNQFDNYMLSITEYVPVTDAPELWDW